MTLTSTLLACASCSAIVAAPLLIRLSAVNTKASLYKAWWERDSARAIIAEAENDLTRQQRIDAGRQSHKAERAVIDARTDDLRKCVAARNVNDLPPAAANPAPGNPAALSAVSIEGGRGRERTAPHHSGQDTGAGQLPDVKQRARAGKSPGQSCRRNRAGYSAPAEITQKGARS